MQVNIDYIKTFSVKAIG